MEANTIVWLHYSASKFDFFGFTSHGRGILTTPMVAIRELIAWDLDDYAYRDAGLGFEAKELPDKIAHAKRSLAERIRYEQCQALLARETESIGELLSSHAQQPKLLEEYAELDWELGVIDMRSLIAFQRRLVFDPDVQMQEKLQQDDWAQLATLLLGSSKKTNFSIAKNRMSDGYLEISLHSGNPDLQLRLSSNTENNNSSPFSIYGGSPFFEVAEFRGRWFLRDGYHRAYRLLKAEIYCVPAVVIHARSIDELGAVQPWFFGEGQLFSATPPLVTDFLQNELIIDYPRQRFIKTIHIRIEESMRPFGEVVGGREEDI